MRTLSIISPLAFMSMPSRIARAVRNVFAVKMPRVVLFCVAMAIASQAQTFTTLLEFNYNDGSFPTYMTLAEGANGKFYGTTFSGGNYHLGTIFDITAGGTLTSLRSFAGPDAANSYGGLVLGSDGNFYGSTACEQTACVSGGTLFKMSQTGSFTSLYTFCSQANCADGSHPHDRLFQGPDGILYGTTSAGGLNGDGTVFSVTSTGTLTTLYSFCSASNCTDGSLPQGGLVQGSNGNFYGTTEKGGNKGDGTIFEISPTGALTTLYSFCSKAKCTDGSRPWAALLQANDGNFYGTTVVGGRYGEGTIFKITPTGTLTTIYSFCAQTNCTDGAQPYANLIQATDGNFYGTANSGGANNYGSIFSITSAGTLTTLYSFCSQPNCTDGTYPNGGLLQASDGTFYGTTFEGGITQKCPWRCAADSAGTIFHLDLGLKGKATTTLGTESR